MKLRSLILFCLVLMPTIARAQDWPTRPIQIILSSGAGGTADILARMIGEQLSSSLGQPVIVCR